MAFQNGMFHVTEIKKKSENSFSKNYCWVEIDTESISSDLGLQAFYSMSNLLESRGVRVDFEPQLRQEYITEIGREQP